MSNFKFGLILIFLTILATGCATTCEPVIQTIEVKVPVIVVPEPPVVLRPTLLSQNVTPITDDYSTFVKSLEADVFSMTKYATDLEQIVNKYKEMSSSNPK
jgi:hypothetical protein